MDVSKMIHRLKTYQNGVHGDFFLEVADLLTSLITEKEPSAQSPAAMAGSAAKAEELKKKISEILMDVLGGYVKKYRTSDGFIRWGVVEGDINETIDAAYEAESCDKVSSPTVLCFEPPLIIETEPVAEVPCSAGLSDVLELLEKDLKLSQRLIDDNKLKRDVEMVQTFQIKRGHTRDLMEQIKALGR